MSKIFLNQRSIIPLDGMDRNQAESFIESTKESFGFYKVGLELFNKYGPEIVSHLTEKYQVKIFLDLKLHDIPKTVHNAIQSLAGLDVAFLTIHLSGGPDMIKSALEAQKQYLPNCQLLGVTLLTSIDDENLKQTFGADTLESEHFIKSLVLLAKSTELKGIVCSALDLPQIKTIYPESICVCPGIRFKDETEGQDQKRIADPLQAIQSGASFLVIGRPLTKAKNKEELSKRIAYLKSQPIC